MEGTLFYAIAQCCAAALACIYWSTAVTDLFNRFMSYITRPVLDPVIYCDAARRPRMIRMNGQVIYREANQKTTRVRNRGGIQFHW